VGSHEFCFLTAVPLWHQGKRISEVCNKHCCTYH